MVWVLVAPAFYLITFFNGNVILDTRKYWLLIWLIHIILKKHTVIIVGTKIFVLYGVAVITYLGTEHRWCEDPIESAPFIILIRDRAPMVQRTLLNLLRLLLLLLLFFFFSKLNRILEGLNMLEKSGNFAHASELVKIYVWYGFQE